MLYLTTNVPTHYRDQIRNIIIAIINTEFSEKTRGQPSEYLTKLSLFWGEFLIGAVSEINRIFNAI